MPGFPRCAGVDKPASDLCYPRSATQIEVVVECLRAIPSLRQWSGALLRSLARIMGNACVCCCSWGPLPVLSHALHNNNTDYKLLPRGTVLARQGTIPLGTAFIVNGTATSHQADDSSTATANDAGDDRSAAAAPSTASTHGGRQSRHDTKARRNSRGLVLPGHKHVQQDESRSARLRRVETRRALRELVHKKRVLRHLERRKRRHSKHASQNDATTSAIGDSEAAAGKPPQPAHAAASPRLLARRRSIGSVTSFLRQRHGDGVGGNSPHTPLGTPRSQRWPDSPGKGRRGSMDDAVLAARRSVRFSSSPRTSYALGGAGIDGAAAVAAVGAGGRATQAYSQADAALHVQQYGQVVGLLRFGDIVGVPPHKVVRNCALMSVVLPWLCTHRHTVLLWQPARCTGTIVASSPVELFGVDQEWCHIFEAAKSPLAAPALCHQILRSPLFHRDAYSVNALLALTRSVAFFNGFPDDVVKGLCQVMTLRRVDLDEVVCRQGWGRSAIALWIRC